MILFFVATAWAWSCLGIKFADLARTNRNPSASLALVVTGQYIEAAVRIDSEHLAIFSDQSLAIGHPGHFRIFR